MARIQLTLTERLILLNQYRILQKLDPDDKTWAELEKVLSSGYAGEYGRMLDGIDPHEMSSEQCAWVRHVLDMFRALHVPELKLNKDDIRFPGFDGNEEGEQYSYMLHLRETRRWPESLHPDDPSYNLNTHTPVSDVYNEMLEIWDAQPEPFTLNPEVAKQLVGILDKLVLP